MHDDESLLRNNHAFFSFLIAFVYNFLYVAYGYICEKENNFLVGIFLLLTMN